MIQNTNLLSLTKLGNLKLGRLNKGNVVSTETILVTTATKDNGENFSIFPNFNPDGESKLKVTLPFESPELNFETNFTTFLKVDDIEFIAKAKQVGSPIILHPLNPEDFHVGAKTLGNLTKELKEKLSFEYTGFLKVMLPNVSSFGEVFYFKTKSINSIRAIQDQLRISSVLLGGLANYPFILKPIRKDVQDKKTITYLSIGIDMDELVEYKKEKEMYHDELNFAGLDELYQESREVSSEDLENLDIDSVVLLANKYEEVVSIRDKDSEIERLIEKADVKEPEIIELIQEHATLETINIILRYYKYITSASRKGKSIFKKSLIEKKKPFQMVQEITAKSSEPTRKEQ